MKASVSIAMIMCGTALIVVPFIHSSLVTKQIVEAMVEALVEAMV
jgi:hypothetical protein